MNGEALLAVQRLDSAIDQLTARRTRIPEVAELAAATSARDAWRGEVGDAQARLEVAEGAIDAAEREGSSLTARQARLEQQLKTVIAPREAEALMHEIDTLKAEHAELDDRELAAMEEQSAETERIAALQAREHEVTAAVEAAAAAYDAAIAQLDAERAELIAQRDEARTGIDLADLAEYDRRRTRFGGVAIAELHGLRCDGCHLDLSRAEVDGFKELPDGVLPECPQCGRFLVR